MASCYLNSHLSYLDSVWACLPSENTISWANDLTLCELVTKWTRIFYQVTFVLFQSIKVGEYFRNGGELRMGPSLTVADPHRPLRVKRKFTNGVLPSRPPSWHDPLMMLGSTFTPSLSSFRTGNSICLWRSESFVTGLLRGHFEITEHTIKI